MLKLKLQNFGHWMRRANSLEKTLMLGKSEGRRRRGWQRTRWWMASPTWWTWVWARPGTWWWTGRPGVLQSMELQRVRYNWVTEQQQPCYEGRYCDPHAIDEATYVWGVKWLSISAVTSLYFRESRRRLSSRKTRAALLVCGSPRLLPHGHSHSR